MALQMWLIDDLVHLIAGLEMAAGAMPDGERLDGFRLACDAMRQAIGVEPRRPVVATGYPLVRVVEQPRR